PGLGRPTRVQTADVRMPTPPSRRAPTSAALPPRSARFSRSPPRQRHRGPSAPQRPSGTPSVDSPSPTEGSKLRPTSRAEAAPGPHLRTSSGERPAGGANPTTSPASPRSRPTPRAATSGSTQPEKHDPRATTSAEPPDVGEQPTRAATPR